MIEDEFKTLERYIKEFEALKQYPRVKKERDSLVVEVAQLKEKVAGLEREASTKNELSSRLTKSEAEVKELAGRLDDAQKELSSLKEFKVKLRDSGELTLEKIRDELLHAEEDEIERRAEQRLAALEKDMLSRMPALVQERLVQLLKCPEWPPEIAKVIDSRARQIADGVLEARDLWPDWFRDYYLEEVNALVNQRLTAEFERRVQAEAEKRLELMKAGEWKQYAIAKAKALTTDLKDMLMQLQGTWWFTCDKCGCRLAFDFSLSDIGLLLRGETIDIACITCLDPAPFPFILSTVRHKIARLRLEGLLSLYMGNTPPLAADTPE